ncbi:MAG TPA: glycosyltransferase family 4 protein [Elusimicrobiota bacterium]|nr:glycosyltransferase family 4 protein [Elusimicrobiota bacterium]
MTAKLKVFLVLECGSPHGVGRQVATLSQHLDRAKFDPWVVYAVRPGFSAAEFERMTRHASHHVHIPEMVRPISPLKDLVAFWKLYRLFRRERPDVVHAESSKAGVLGRVAACLAGVPRIYYSPHGYSFLQTDSGPLGRKLYWWLEKLFSGIGHIIVCSPGEEKLARELSWGRPVFQVRNLFVMDDPAPRAPEPHGDTVLVGALGRLTHARNPEAFLRLAQRLSRAYPKTRFLWIGGGELEGAVRDLLAQSGLQDRFEITGHVSREEVLAKLSSLDVFVHYSRWEGGAPIALHEALYFAKPVVVSNIAGNVDLVAPGVNGFLASNEDELFEHVSLLVESPQLRADLGRAGKAFLEREISLKKSITQLERLYAGESA